MRDRRVRLLFVGLILAFPVLMTTMNQRARSARDAAVPLIAVEALLIAGLSGVARERRRLLDERLGSRPASRPLPTAPMPVPIRRRMVAAVRR